MYQVVFVDDESFVLEGLKKAIDWFGFNMEIVLATTSPVEALDYMKAHPTHLLLTDISMPEMTGIELIQRAREVNPSLFILVLSAYDTFAYVRSAMQSGAENYLLKPLDPDELSESVSLIVNHLENRSKMSEYFGPTMLTFRSNFVENWCKGNLSEEEFITRASMLGVNLQLNNYTVDNYDDVSSSYHNVKKYSHLQYSPVSFIICQNFLFPLPYQKLIEQNFSETTEADYIQGIRTILAEVSPERRISIQLAVVNWGIS